MTTETLTLTDFLLARIAEDEAAADATGTFGQPRREDDALPQRWDYDLMHVGSARWLAECEAKRRIVEREGQRVRAKIGSPAHTVGRPLWVDEDDWFVCLSGRWLGREESREFRDQWYEPAPPSATLRDIATVYADHPDYRDEWRVG